MSEEYSKGAQDLRWLLKIIGGSETPTCEWRTHDVWHRLNAFCDKLDESARLIAAAPELLAALKDAEAQLQLSTRYHHAIAKAEGRAE